MNAISIRLGLLALVLGLPVAVSAAPKPATTWKEVPLEGEAEIFQALPAEFNGMQSNVAEDAGGGAERGLHNKPHTTVRAALTVVDGIPDPYRQGFFAKPGTYQTWVRFSNGRGNRGEDRQPDLRGMAVKILNAPGDNLNGEGSFDIVCNNFAAQPARNIIQFMSFIRAQQKSAILLPLRLANDLGWAEAKRILSWAAANLGTRVTSLATTNFFTGVPLQYGPYACKIRLTARNGEPPAAAGSSDRDYLRWDLWHRLTGGDLHWDVMVQLFVDETKTPIEDASVVWQEADAPYVKVAELTISKRDMAGSAAAQEEATGNQLLWNPWNAPKEHRPLGNLMRARQVVYPASGKFRGAVAPK